MLYASALLLVAWHADMMIAYEYIEGDYVIIVVDDSNNFVSKTSLPFLILLAILPLRVSNIIRYAVSSTIAHKSFTT